MTNDFLMRQIEDMARSLGSTLFLRNTNKHDIFNEEGQLSPENFFVYRLKRLVAEGKINEAENLLFETLQANPKDEYFTAALDFYETLQEISDAELERSNFSRKEIFDGLTDITRLYKQYAPTEELE